MNCTITRRLKIYVVARSLAVWPSIVFAGFCEVQSFDCDSGVIRTDVCHVQSFSLEVPVKAEWIPKAMRPALSGLGIARQVTLWYAPIFIDSDDTPLVSVAALGIGARVLITESDVPACVCDGNNKRWVD